MTAAAAALRAARPTAVNLAWGVDEALRRVAGRRRGRGARPRRGDRGRPTSPPTGALGAHGAALLPPVASVLTHCNAGALACVGYGTALGVIRAAHEARPAS